MPFRPMLQLTHFASTDPRWPARASALCHPGDRRRARATTDTPFAVGCASCRTRMRRIATSLRAAWPGCGEFVLDIPEPLTPDEAASWINSLGPEQP